MHASVKVLDIDIDMMTNDVFVQKMNEYLSDDKLDVILFASTELLDKAMGEESYREVIEQADLILPGEEALLSAHHVEVLEAGGMVVSCKSFGIMLENLQKKDQSVYIIGKSSTEVEQLETWCKRMQPGLRLSGSVVYDPDMEAAALINEINNHTPDILLVDLETGPQEIWIMEHLPLLHARLCVAIGGHGELHKKPYIGDALREIEYEDIPRAGRLLYATAALSLVLFGAVRFLLVM